MSFRRIKCEFVISYDPNGDNNFNLYDKFPLTKYDLINEHNKFVFRNSGFNQIKKLHCNANLLFNLTNIDLDINKIYICQGIQLMILKSKEDLEKIVLNDDKDFYIGLM
jgi:hypothetical protein